MAELYPYPRFSLAERDRRWQPVIVRNVGNTDAAVVKRVVGFPGEAVQLRGGNVYVNGQLARKTLDDQRALAVVAMAVTAPSSGNTTAMSASPPPPTWLR